MYNRKKSLLRFWEEIFLYLILFFFLILRKETTLFLGGINLNKIREYGKKFVSDESGMELLQLAIVVVITVGLITVVMGLQTSIRNKIKNSSEAVDKMPDGSVDGSAGSQSGN